MHSMIVPVLVHRVHNPKKQIRTYALLDNQSNSYFMTGALTDELIPLTEDVHLKLTNMLESQIVQSRVVKGLVIQGVGAELKIDMPIRYTYESIPGEKTLFPRQL